MSTLFRAAVTPQSEIAAPPYYFIFQGFRLLVCENQGTTTIPLSGADDAPPVALIRRQYLGELEVDGSIRHCYCGEVDDQQDAPPGYEYLSLRKLFGRIDDSLLAVAGRAVQIVDWDRTHQYCGQCGTAVEQLPYERAKRCPACLHTSYPRISPAIIVSVERSGNNGRELLLARNRRHPLSFFSVLAGFVEPGENLEACVRREVREEVGLELKHIEYFGSQSWPFPNSLMIAFRATYAGGDIVLEEEELAEAGWFTADKLPHIPPRASIARQLIEAFIAENQTEPG